MTGQRRPDSSLIFGKFVGIGDAGIYDEIGRHSPMFYTFTRRRVLSKWCPLEVVSYRVRLARLLCVGEMQNVLVRCTFQNNLPLG